MELGASLFLRFFAAVVFMVQGASTPGTRSCNYSSLADGSPTKSSGDYGRRPTRELSFAYSIAYLYQWKLWIEPHVDELLLGLVHRRLPLTAELLRACRSHDAGKRWLFALLSASPILRNLSWVSHESTACCRGECRAVRLFSSGAPLKYYTTVNTWQLSFLVTGVAVPLQYYLRRGILRLLELWDFARPEASPRCAVCRVIGGSFWRAC